MYKKFLLFIFFFSVYPIKAQWNKLPLTPTISDGAMAIDNGRVIYWKESHISQSSGFGTDFYESYDDLSSSYYRGGVDHDPGAYPGILNFKKDSSFLIVAEKFYGQMGIYYSNGKFTGYGFEVSFCNSNSFIYPFITTELTNSYIYVTGQHLASDTFVVSRIKTTSLSSDTCIKLYNYNGQSNTMQFVNDSVGFILCSYRSNLNKQALLKTINYGTTWSEIYLDSLVSLKTFHFPSSSTGYILKSNGSIVKTLNGGSTWVATNLPDSAKLDYLKFSSNNIGYVGGSTGFISKTIDGGGTWSTQINDTTYNITYLYVFPNDVAYFSSHYVDLYKNKPLGVPPVITISQSRPIVCAGNSVTLTASGASTYTWSANAGGSQSAVVSVTPTVNTTYTVTGTKGAYTNTATISVNVKQSPLPSIAITSPNAPVCIGSKFTLVASGVNTYTWNTGFHYLDSASVNEIAVSNTKIYKVEGTDSNGCIGTQTTSININPLPIITIISLSDSVCLDSTFILTASGANTYTWNMGFGQSDSSATEVAVSDTTIYEVTGTNLLGCTATQTISINVTHCSAGKRLANGFVVYPNPASTNITIQCYPAIIENIDIFDVRGQLVFSQSLSGNVYQIDMNEYNKGLYFIRVKTSDNLYNKKILVQP